MTKNNIINPWRGVMQVTRDTDQTGPLDVEDQLRGVATTAGIATS